MATLQRVPLDDVCSAVDFCCQVVAMIKELLETRIRPAVQVGSTRADPAHPRGIGTAPPGDRGDGCIAPPGTSTMAVCVVLTWALILAQ